MKRSQTPKIALQGARRLALVGAACLLTLAQGADAAPWNIDFYQGPVVNSQRAVGLGGAFVGIAEGSDGHLSNPASFAVRQPFFGNDWFDWDLGASGYAVLGDTDYDLSGRTGQLSSAFTEQGGFNLKFGRFGIGGHTFAQQFGLVADAVDGETGAKRSYVYAQSFGGLGLAYAFEDGEWVIGMLLGTGSARITAQHTGEQVTLQGTAWPAILGGLWAPRGKPWRVGVSLRPGMTMTQPEADAVKTIGGLPVPDSVVMGPTIDIGGSWMFGARTYNIRPSYGDEPLPKGAKHVKDIERDYLLVTAALTITGAVENGVGVIGYLTQERQASGASGVMGIRMGAESEVMPNRLVVRGGTYLEPSRFARSPRLHATMGVDVRVTVYWDWRLTWALDLAPDYSNSAIGIGFWH